ncbi:phosphate--AMP phosphotransferase [Candidatus Methanomassiliicoccus intestinalis]|uniref:phosphate--AMP phosphotransferase n=1 Tax=Candidatus Methanomassiliicoccus intestinalis TaxID=1406512 RepID=UPI0037DC3EE2
MLQNLDPHKKLKKGEFKKQIPNLRNQLGELQRKLRRAEIPVIILFEGWEPALMAKVINQLLVPLDPRGFDYYNIGPSSNEEAKHQFLWRFWIKTPAKGRIAIFDRSWYSSSAARSMDAGSDELIVGDLKQIHTFERQLADSGVTIIKLFLHVEADNREPTDEETCGLVKDDLDLIKRQEQYLPLIDKMITATESPFAPWTIVESANEEFATLKVLKTVVNRMESALETNNNISDGGYCRMEYAPIQCQPPHQKLDDETYYTKLEKYQQRLKVVQMELYKQKRPLLLVFEGRDAAGKGGTILRMTQSLNPRTYQVVPTGAPNDVEIAHHYLWRFYLGLPAKGHISIFDRSWYGRVLVERVDNLTSETDWRRAYREINEFEKSLVDDGTILIKMWLEISKAEQLQRFIERVDNPLKNWKISDDDWKAREKWDRYTEAINEMIARTSPPYAPWIIIDSNDKHSARLQAHKSVLEITEKELGIK